VFVSLILGCEENKCVCTCVCVCVCVWAAYGVLLLSRTRVNRRLGSTGRCTCSRPRGDLEQRVSCDDTEGERERERERGEEGGRRRERKMERKTMARLDRWRRESAEADIHFTITEKKDTHSTGDVTRTRRLEHPHLSNVSAACNASAIC